MPRKCSSDFMSRLLVILFITEGAEHTEEMIKDMVYLLYLICVGEASRCTLWLKMVFKAGVYASQVWFKFMGDG